MLSTFPGSSSTKYVRSAGRPRRLRVLRPRGAGVVPRSPPLLDRGGPYYTLPDGDAGPILVSLGPRFWGGCGRSCGSRALCVSQP